MNFATINDLKEIMDIFKIWKKQLPYIRKDYLERKINNHNVIFENGVIIIFGFYKRKQHIGNCLAEKGDCYWTEIACKDTTKAGVIFEKFLNHINVPIWSTLRDENVRSRVFQVMYGFEYVGKISWKNGTIPGSIFYYSKQKSLLF